MIITTPPVCLNQTAFIYCLVNCIAETFKGSIRYLSKSYPSNLGTIYFYGNYDKRLSFGSATSLTRLFSANISFINFNYSSKIIPTWSNHSSSKFMKPCPSCFITAQTHHSLNTKSTGTIFLTSQPPYSSKPKNKGFMSPMKYCTSYYRYFMITICTLIKTFLERPSFFMVTTWTCKTIWPSQFKKIITASFLRAKSFFKFHDVFGVIFHYPIIYI